MAIQKHNSGWIRGNFIGKGSYGSVSLGIRESDGGVFAVKSAAKDSLASIDALENEIRVLRSLESYSPFIVEFHGDDETLSHRNLFLEYVSGGDVAKAGAVSDVELIRSYTWCLVMALKSIHSEGIIHCDVKGSNVLLCSDSGIAKLTDFGSAKRVDDDDQSKMVPRGSPLWMAPEVVRGESQEFESDIWSLGCTVIEMFTGKPAWQDIGPHTLFQIGYSNDIPEYPAKLPDLARDFLDKCLNQNPHQRWSCDQLLQHPFLVPAPATKIAESSPRSIFDWQTLEFSQDDHESEAEDFDEVSARSRICNLATTAGLNWENDDGWVDVRGLSKEVEAGASSEYSNFARVEEVITASSTAEVNWEDDCDCATSENLDGGDEMSGGGLRHGGLEFEFEHKHGSCGQSGEVDSCGVMRREKLVTAVFMGFSFFSFLLYYYYSCILSHLLGWIIKIIIFFGATTMVKYFDSLSLNLSHIEILLDSSTYALLSHLPFE